jgi:chromosome segregation ATPase
MTIPSDPPAVSINPPSPQGLERIDTIEESNRQLVAEKHEMEATITALRAEISSLQDQVNAAEAQQDRRPSPRSTP